MTAIFAVPMLRFTTLKIRKLSFTLNFLELYALLFMAQPKLILEDAPTNSYDSGEDDDKFQCHTESQIQQLFTQS
jgi:hypothetical protein